MEKQYNFGEATVIPDDFITKNCGDVACRELDTLVRKFSALGARTMRCDEFAREWAHRRKVF
jgi:hypothetical protein